MKSTFFLLALIYSTAALNDDETWRSSPKFKRDTSSESLSPRSEHRKYVFAHHVVGNTFPYSTADWRKDINAAIEYGIDGFALNVGNDPWEADRVRDAYAAASGTTFKLFISLDMTSLPCAAPSDAVPLRKYVTDYASHPNQLIYRGRVLISTFAGSASSCNFGQSSVSAGWTSQLTSQLNGVNRVWFVPAFFDDVSAYSSYSSFMDGEVNWNSAWPVNLTANNINSFRRGSKENSLQTVLSGDPTDTRVLNALASMPNGGQKIYIPAVSPWFFTHYGPTSWNKNWVYYSDDHMYNVRWEALIANRAKFDIVELLTWNDYGESSYIGNISGAQPNSQAWVNGFEHTAWLSMTKYYADAFRAGAYPALSRDRIYLICRPHARDAQALNDQVGPPANYKMVADKVWAVVFASKPATFVLSTSATNNLTTQVSAGVTKTSISIGVGDYMRGQIIRGKAPPTIDFRPNFTFQGTPQTYNFNAFVAASP